APLTVTAQTDSRGYNGTTSSSVAPVVTGTLFDAVGAAATQSYDTKNVGTTHVLSASGLVVNDGNAGANYAISYVPSAATGTITTSQLTATAQTDSRGYNGTTSSSAAPVVTGTIPAAPLPVTAQTDSRGYNDTTSPSAVPARRSSDLDAVGAAATQSYDTKNVGTTHVLSASGLVVNDGNAGANYAISYVPSAATGTITAAPLTVTAQTDSRGYNGTTSSSVAPVVTGTLFD